MPKCGSQILICDLPVRFDTYIGCSHACAYCFVAAKQDITRIKVDEGVKALTDFINGKRNKETKWCDWDIPIHWGGCSDPLQPIETTHKVSYECLKIFAETQYPFLISTKGELLGDDKYIDLLSKCNCVVQVSLVSPQFDKIEKGAPSYRERLDIIRKVAPRVKRLNIRVQPYVVEIHKDLINAIPEYKAAGVHGITVESMKYKRRLKGLIKVQGDLVYPLSTLRPRFLEIKEVCKSNNLAFYSGENRLRSMGDSLCCCGIEGMDGFKENRYNLNHYLFDADNFTPTDMMCQIDTAESLTAIRQDSVANKALKKLSLRDCMIAATNDKGYIQLLKPYDR